jgi:phosphate transport system substrate-binding protein
MRPQRVFAATCAALACALALALAPRARGDAAPFPWLHHPKPSGSPSATPLPTPTPTPRLIVHGAGDALPADDGAGRNTLFGFLASITKNVRTQFCETDAETALVAFAGDTTPCEPIIAASPAPPAPSAPPLDFVAADVPLTATSYAAIAAAHHGTPVQIPYVAAGVAIVYDNPDVRGPLAFSVLTLCKIASGEITDWSAIPRDPANPSGLAFPPRPLRFVYRADPSGETFALANFLSAVDARGRRRTCVRDGMTFGLSDRFVPDATHAGMLPSPLPRGATRAVFLGAASAADEIACVLGSPAACRGAVVRGRAAQATPRAGTVGYALAAGTAAPMHYPAGIARLRIVREGIARDEDPVADLPGVATKLTRYATNAVLAPPVPNRRPPEDLVPLPPVASHTTAAAVPCLAVIPPAAYADPAVGYPIVAITNLLFHATGNGEATDALQTLAGLTNESKNFTYKRIRTIDPDGASTGTTGYSVLPLSTQKKTGLPNLIAHCIGR